MLRSKIVVVLLFFATLVFGQGIRNEDDLFDVLKHKDKLVDHVLANQSVYYPKIIYTSVEKTGDSLELETFELNTGKYFYPASTVKLPTALLTLEKMKRLGISRKDYLRMNSDVPCGSQTFVQLSQRRNISFEEMLSEMIVVSDNNYYNSLYHFLRPGELNAELRKKGFYRANIYRSFTGCDVEEHLTCNSFVVKNSRGELIYQDSVCTLPREELDRRYFNDEGRLFGSKHENSEGRIVEGPYDFNYNLEIRLRELHEMLVRLIYPEQFPEAERWDIREEDRLFLIKLLGMYPSELKNPKYKNQTKYPDTIYKYVLIGEGNPTGTRTYSKIGLSYGFSTEVAYFVDAKGKAYFISMCLYTNANDTVNDGKYEYNEVARPFFARVAKIIMESHK